MNIDVVEFGRNGYPDKLIQCAHSEMLEGIGGGCGLMIFSMKNPGRFEWDGTDVPAEEVGNPIIGLWFHREESLDSVIRKLQELKRMFGHDKPDLEQRL